MRRGPHKLRGRISHQTSVPSRLNSMHGYWWASSWTVGLRASRSVRLTAGSRPQPLPWAFLQAGRAMAAGFV